MSNARAANEGRGRRHGIWLSALLAALACSAEPTSFEAREVLLRTQPEGDIEAGGDGARSIGALAPAGSRLVVSLARPASKPLPPLRVRRDGQAPVSLDPTPLDDGRHAYAPLSREDALVILDFPDAGLDEHAITSIVLESPAQAKAEVRVERRPYNLLVIVLDSLRADHLSPYGAPAEDTPHLAELASKSVVFTQARTNASWTRPAVVSMFTSQYPWAHGVLTPEARVPEPLPYLPELLRGAGYRTVGASGNDMVSALFGLDRGFDTLTSLRKSPRYQKTRDPLKRAGFVWDALLARAAAQDEPFFAYLHHLDPHSPYHPPGAYRARYLDPSQTSSDERLEEVRHLRVRGDELSDRQIDTLARLYRGEVAFMDAYVGELMQQLELRGLAANTIVVFTSDHGEEFDEHGSMGHGHSVYEELLRVPLLVRLDGVLPAGRRIEAPVSLADLAPTLLDLLGQPVPEAMVGMSLLPMMLAGESPGERLQWATSGVPSRYAVQWGDAKLIRERAGSADGAPIDRLFDLRLDPQETTDIAGAKPITTRALAGLLDRELQRTRAAGAGVPRVRIDPETLEALRAIGYLDVQ